MKLETMAHGMGFDYLLKGFGFLATANGKVSVVSPDLSSQHLRRLAETGLADCFYHPEHFEAVMIRRRLENFPFAFHYISDQRTRSTKRKKGLKILEEHANSLSARFLKVDREDVQHFQALSARLNPDKLVRYLESEAEQGQQSQVSNNRKPFPSRAYQNLTDAVAAIEGTERDVKFLGANESIFTFTGSLGEPTFPFRGMGGVLKLAEYDEDSPRIEILFGPYIMLGSGQKDAFKPFEWYFNRTYQIGEGKEVRLELTESDSHRHNGIAYVNPEQVLESAELLTNLSSEAEGVSPILCDPTIYMLTEAFKKRFEEGLVSLGTKVSLNRMMMYRGASEGAAKVLESCEQDIEKVPDPIFKSNFYICFADTCMRLGKLDPALGYTNKALEHSKDNFDAHLIAGITHQIAGDYQEAEKRLEQSLAISETEIAQQSLDRTRRVQELM